MGHEQSCPLITPGPVHVCARCQEIHGTVSRTRCFSNFTSQCEILIFGFTNNSHSYEKLDPTLRGRAKQHSLEVSRRILSNQTHKFVSIYSPSLTFTAHCLWMHTQHCKFESFKTEYLGVFNLLPHISVIKCIAIFPASD